MVIIRVNAHMNGPDMARTVKEIKAQAAKDGIIVLPHWCELLNEVPADDGVQIVQQTQDARVEELEQELARAMFYISAQKDCATCKHDPILGDLCFADCTECKCDGCRCRHCREGSLWEWVGIHGSK